ncbi:MAG: hypothetical protein COC15_03025 [Legionellales bacterium]|nr:MAG: hypothetical protein COC15_03025 [Legionellales bacterium]
MPIHLEQDTTHIWLVDFNDNTFSEEIINNFLDATDIKRASKFSCETTKTTHTKSRAMLRFLLGNYLNIAPKDITFTKNDFNKPSICKSVHIENLHFNLSHSNNLGMFTISKDEVGCDIEVFKPRNFMKIAKRYFTHTEHQLLVNTPKHLQQRLFFSFWTQKEAFVKYQGLTLARAMNNWIAQPILPDDAQERELYCVRNNDVTVSNLLATKNAMAAVVVKNVNAKFRMMRFEELSS